MLLELALPLTNPVLKFLLILVIILFAPIILNKIKIPYLLGLIIAGALVGPKGINLIERDNGIILSGTAGLLYIMFLAGLEIDLADFKKNSKKSIIFGLYTFCIPMLLGTLAGLYLLKLSIPTSVLLASMFASHTLIAYPLVSKMGVAKNIAVNITVGGTLITDTLALLVLAVIVGMTTGEVNTLFWIRLTIYILLFGLTVMILFPIIGRWFFKRFDDSVSQYIFVLVMVFLGAVLAELAGVEAIIGAFLSGLALNRLIPHTSPLMNRIEFVGNAIFIPFFLIGVGMLIDYRVFFNDLVTIKVALVMIIVATSAKFLAAWFTQKTFQFSADQRRLIFGLSNAQAAATLAAVLVGYNIITGETPAGEPIRLLSENILNGTILMILFTCTIASFVAQRGAKNIALSESLNAESDILENNERVLIPISNIDTIDELINLGITVKSKTNKDGLYALSIVDNSIIDNTSDKQAQKILNKATITASATDNRLQEILRYDSSIVNGITSVVKEQKITDLILGLHISKGISDSFLGNLTEGILTKCNTTTLVYKPAQPLNTIKRHLIIVPENSEKDMGFPFWIVKIWNIAKNTGAQLVFYANKETLRFITQLQSKQSLDCTFEEFSNWEDFLILAKNFKQDDNLILVLSRIDKPSYNNTMSKIPTYLNKYFKETSYMLIYPMQAGALNSSKIDFKNPTLNAPLEKLDQLGKSIARLFRKKSK
ncbi:cation:proton antiporter [Leeuwenhoekiella sp. MAR_2009_132]|uniref:cation:proton antiporter n=1 Tax=Leeuwenhoekiella sp. MAR_2009_132 TaxID=1392489 RepID=UPI00056093D6|nr:cation:proton antiporter [Leeuwenhoekiella sp. MAR_2009_132]